MERRVAVRVRRTADPDRGSKPPLLRCQAVSDLQIESAWFRRVPVDRELREPPPERLPGNPQGSRPFVEQRGNSRASPPSRTPRGTTERRQPRGRAARSALRQIDEDHVGVLAEPI